jgi:hypothetical protein
MDGWLEKKPRYKPCVVRPGPKLIELWRKEEEEERGEQEAAVMGEVVGGQSPEARRRKGLEHLMEVLKGVAARANSEEDEIPRKKKNKYRIPYREKTKSRGDGGHSEEEA